MCAYVTEHVYKLPDSLVCNLQFYVSYMLIMMWENVDPNHVFIHIIEYNSTLNLIVYMTVLVLNIKKVPSLLIVNTYIPF
jgi:hypothetical protein